MTLKEKLAILLAKGLTTNKVATRMSNRLESSDADNVEEATEFITSSWTAYEKTTRAKKVEITTLSGGELEAWRLEQKKSAIAGLVEQYPKHSAKANAIATQHGLDPKEITALCQIIGKHIILMELEKADKLAPPKMKKDLATGEMTTASNNRLREQSQIVNGKVFAVENARGKTTKNEKVVEVESSAKVKGFTLLDVEDYKCVKIVSSKTDANGNRHAQITPIVRQFPLEHAGEGCCPAETEFQQLEHARQWMPELNRWIVPHDYNDFKNIKVCCNAKVKGGGKYCARHSKGKTTTFTGLPTDWASVVVG